MLLFYVANYCARVYSREDWKSLRLVMSVFGVLGCIGSLYVGVYVWGTEKKKLGMQQHRLLHFTFGVHNFLELNVDLVHGRESYLCYCVCIYMENTVAFLLSFVFFIPTFNGYEKTFCKHRINNQESGLCVFQGLYYYYYLLFSCYLS